MKKFFKKYELPFKIVAVMAWMFAAVWKFFFKDRSENPNFELFVGIVMILLGVFYLFEVIELVKKRRTQKHAE